MRIKQLHITLGTALAAVPLASAQGTFENLNFEQASIVPISGQPFAITVANALPYWTVDYGPVQQTQIYYNSPSTGATQVTLIANGYPSYFGGTAIDGNFSVLLQSGFYQGEPATSSISQTGQIPSAAQSLFFYAGGYEPEVFIGNDELNLFQIGYYGNSPIYGANISAWAGQTEQLTFMSTLSFSEIDDISFSPTAVIPEPSPLALAGLGTILFALYRRCGKARGSVPHNRIFCG